MSRAWAMPSKHTFMIKPIGDFVRRWMASYGDVWADPFSGWNSPAQITNDLNPDAPTTHHMDAEEFVRQIRLPLDGALFDPPYSPRQISECYKGVGLAVGMKETQSALLYKRVRDAIHEKLSPGGIVLSFGWNSVGMGKKRGYEIEEILLVCHGGAHNDTICVAERRKSDLFTL